MGRYVLRRLLQMIPVLIGTTFIIFSAVFALPGDPLAGKCGERPCPPDFVAAFTDKYNLDDPLLIRYAKYIGNLLQGDFGDTYRGEPIIDVISRTYPTTVKLALVAIGFELIVGIGLGILAGLRRGGVVDFLVLSLTTLLVAVPVFVIGYAAREFMAAAGLRPTVSSRANIQELIVPGLVLAGLSLAYVARLMRTSLVENRRSDYVRTAIAKGLTKRRVIGVHTVRNSLIPVITYIGADFGALLGGAIVTEGIFNIQGIGGEVYRAIRGREGATVVGIVTLLVLVFLLVNLLVDLLYAVLDPRIRYE